MTPSPGSGAYARKMLPPSEHPEHTRVFDNGDGEVLAEEFEVARMVDGEWRKPMLAAGTIYAALTIAEAHHAATGEPCRITHTVERVVAQVGVPE